MVQKLSGLAHVLAPMLVVWASHAVADAPRPSCDGPEGGMYVWDTRKFAHEDSGYIMEQYANPKNEAGLLGGLPGPVPQLDRFFGFRITDCQGGRFVAVEEFDQDLHANDKALTATEFLRAKVQSRRRFDLRDVERAARAVFGELEIIDTKRKARIMRFREPEETCGCATWFPDHWNTR